MRSETAGRGAELGENARHSNAARSAPLPNPLSQGGEGTFVTPNS